MQIDHSNKTPVHIISGFLGVGKTTTIINLLKQRQQNENIAVVVNEYGEIGIDGAILETEGKPFSMKEVPGGCICCSSGEMLLESFQQILDEIKPTRIIIEPSGLARPSDIKILLNTSSFADRIYMKPMISLIDPELYCDDDFRDSIVFDDQIESADILVITRTDIATEQQILRVENDIETMFPAKLEHFKISNGNLNASVLDLEYKKKFSFIPPRRSTGNRHEKDFIGKGFQWESGIFSFEKLKSLFQTFIEGSNSNDFVRVKGIFNTTEGWKIMEIAGRKYYERESEFRFENRVDFIIDPKAEAKLLTLQLEMERCFS